jgi:hypothetical protein
MNLLFDVGREAGIHNHMTGLSASICQVVEVCHVDILEKQLETFSQFKTIEDGIVWVYVV